MVRYPLGVQSFETLITEGFVYVDKTGYVYDLTHGNSSYIFLSRPRRFGKTLLTTTLKAYFEGKKALFKGLAIERLEKDWIQYPVIHLSLNGCKGADSASLTRYIDNILQEEEQKFGITGGASDLNIRLNNLIVRLHQTTGQKAVVLIDEYDAPLLDVVHEEENLPALRKIMRNFYAPLKKCEEHLRFVFLTGITKFSQLSIFSELNNINNMSMDSRVAAICGITEEELLNNFAEGISALAANLEITTQEALDCLRQRYDGYHFAWPSPGVYNPYSLLHALDKCETKAYWFSSGTPSFIIEMLRKHPEDPISLAQAIETSEAGFNISLECTEDARPLLFQSGYLTIKGYNRSSGIYTLGIPNGEVREGLMENLIPMYMGGTRIAGIDTAGKMRGLLFKGNMDGALTLLQTYLRTVPGAKNTGYEGHWQQMLYIIFSLIGFQLDVEYPTPTGRMDLALYAPDTTYIIELKVGKSAEEALDQIITKDYPGRFALSPKPLTLVGIHFSLKERNLSSWTIEPAAAMQ